MKIRSTMKFSLQALQGDFGALSQHGLVRYLPSTFVALSAFPLIWFTLDATMRKAEQREIAYHDDLRTLGTVMRSFKNVYEVCDGVWRSVGQIVSFAISMVPTEETIAGTSRSLSRRQMHWEDFQRKRPHAYLQLSLAIDYSIRFGRCPTEVDLAGICVPQEDDRAVIADQGPAEEDAYASYLAFHTFVQEVEQSLLFA